MNNAPRIRLCELREYVSGRSGKHYLSGFLGGARVLVLRDDQAECTGREVARWSVFLEQQPPREACEKALATRRASDRGAGPARRKRPASGMDSTRRRGNTAAERRARARLQERGIDRRSGARGCSSPVGR